MDFESYIGKERQLISRLDRERSGINAYEKRSDQGSLDLTEDEIKLLRMGRFLKSQIEMANESSRMLDEKMARLKASEDKAELKNAELVLRIVEWENSFDARYKELMGKVESEIKAMESQNMEFQRLIKEQEQIFAARNVELSDKVESAEKSFKATSDSTYAEINQLVSSLKEAQKEFELSVNEKLEQDKMTIEKIKYMISTMSDIIKV